MWLVMEVLDSCKLVCTCFEKFWRVIRYVFHMTFYVSLYLGLPIQPKFRGVGLMLGYCVGAKQSNGDITAHNHVFLEKGSAFHFITNI